MMKRRKCSLRKRATALVLLLASSLLVHAHEFWMQAEKYILKPGENLLISYKVGENFIGNPVSLKKDRVEKLEIHHLQNVKNLKGLVKEGDKENITLPMNEEGTHMVVMQSTSTFVEMQADTFNAYLEEDGLDDIYALREKTNTLNKDSKEFYSRHTKLLVQVGSKADDTFKKTAGLPIEIIPMKNPYALKVGDRLTFKVLWQGKPLFGALVRVWNRYNNRTTQQNIYALQDGTIEARITSPGPWMVSVVKMVPSKDPKADYQSYWGSLVFGIQ
ncbi:MAG: DUF4198 domain-containing protein [Bacteroidota bacterium]